MTRERILALMACAGAAARLVSAGVVVDGTAAIVNEEPITVGDVLRAMEPERRRILSTQEGEERDRLLRRAYARTLAQLVERRAILHAYEKGKGRIPDEVLDARIDAVVEERFGSDRHAFTEALREGGISIEEWRRGMREQIIVSAMTRNALGGRVSVSPAAIREFYEEHRDSYDVPETVKMRMIVLDRGGTAAERDASLKRAADVREGILGGQDFAETAKSLSRGRRAEAGGEWDWMSPDGLRAELRQAVAGMDVGEIGPVVTTDDHLYLIKLEGRRPGGVKPLSEVRESIARELEAGERERLYRDWINGLMADMSVQIFSRQQDSGPDTEP